MEAKLYRDKGESSLRNRISSLLKDAYNSETGELWGRDPFRWGES